MIKQIYAILRLTRWVNLVIIALSMVLFQYCVIHTYLYAADVPLTMTVPYFALLVLAVVLIAAGGNVVNDYLDYEQDAEHRPDRVIIGRYISIDNAFNLQLGLNVSGILIGFFLAWHMGNMRLGYVFISAVALLWLYSLTLKKYFLIGNVLIAALSAIVFVMPVLFEPRLSDYFQTDYQEMAAHSIHVQLRLYCFFAFMVSLMREIIKDAEDRGADIAYNMKTLPALLPVWAVNAVVVLIMLITAAVIAYVEVFFWQHNLKKHFWFSIFFLQFPLVTNMFTVIPAKNSKDYHNISVLLKLLMFFGLLSMPVYYLFITVWK